MQSEMISKPCQRFSSVCASIDTEVDRMIACCMTKAMTHFVRVEAVMFI